MAINRRKSIYIGLSLVLVLVMGIYFYSGDGSTAVDRERGIAAKTTLHPHPEPVADIKPVASPIPAQTTSKEADPYVFYPDAILGLLKIDMEKMMAERDAFKNTIVHVEWMNRISNVLHNMDPEKREAIVQNHTALLYIKDLLNRAYLTGEIDHETFTKTLADLMKWHQKTYALMLTNEEYEALFEIKPEMAEEMINDMIEATPRYSFILNQEISTEEVTKQVQAYKLEEVDSHFREMILNRDQIGKKINAGEMTLEQARETLNQSQQAFIAKCKQMLTPDEINTIFGSVAALESGQTQTEQPAVLGDSDLAELGFKIENQDTSIEKVRNVLDKGKIEDVSFFYQQRAEEREKLVSRLNAGEIKEEELEKISGELDATFQENCRSILTDAEFKIIFNNQARQK
ncbi:MAG: hypothetical protein ABIK15_19025 [Pseudomonadota bacterium]